MELIEDDAGVVSESEIRTGPTGAMARSMTGAALLVLAVGLAIVLFRPSTDSTSPQGDDEAAGEAGPDTSSIAEAGTAGASEAGTAGVSEDGASEDRVSPAMTFVLPERVPIPEQLPVPPPGQKALTLIGQNGPGQIVAFELSSGSVAEIDPVSGQRFKARAASANRVAGFRVFLGETISLGADGSIRSMPVTEMDLPLVFPKTDGSGFVVVEGTTNALWLVNDDDSIQSLAALPAGVTPEWAVDTGLIVRTLDGVARRYDLATAEVGEALVGSPLAVGRDRYVTLSCDAGICRVTVRAIGSPVSSPEPGVLDADEVIAEFTNGLTIDEQPTISPSGRRLAFAGNGAVTVVDLDRGTVVARLDEAGNAAFVWGPDDTLFYWRPPAQLASESRSVELRLFDTDGQRSAIQLPSSVIDLNQPLHVVRSTN